MAIVHHPKSHEMRGLMPIGKVTTAETSQGKTLNKLAKLMEDIAEVRKTIVMREALVKELQNQLAKNMQPIEEKVVDLRIKTLRVLAGYLKSPLLKKREYRILHESLCELADELEFQYNIDLEKERTTLLGQVKSTDIFEDNFEDEFMTAMEEFLSQRENKNSRSSQSEQNGFNPHEDDDFINPHQYGGRKKTKANTKKSEEEETIEGDIRALYLLLARALHPDKENDFAKQQEKTVWMQKVTAAYGAHNLAALLDILAQNPLDCVGPYLSQAPKKTVEGFAKRLRRELTILRNQADAVYESIHPDFQDFIRNDKLNMPRMKGFFAAAKRELGGLKNRLKMYQELPDVHEFITLLDIYGWQRYM